MPAEIENMAYRGQVPWHGLGISVADADTPEEMAAKADMLWRVGLRYPQIRLSRTDPTQVLVDKNHVAVVRESDNHIYQYASPDYKPVQNADIIRFFKRYCENGQFTMETLGTLGKGGAVVWALARVNHGSDFTLVGNDTVKAYLLLANSHDSSLVYTCIFTDIRVVCMNTLRMALSDAKGRKHSAIFRMKHNNTHREEIEDDAHSKLDSILRTQRQMYETAQRLSETKVTPELTQAYVYQLVTGERLLDVIANERQAITLPTNGGSLLNAIADTHSPITSFKPILNQEQQETFAKSRMGQSILESIVSSPGSQLESARGTLWGALNGVTYHADHEAGRARDTALHSAWFGQASNRKAEALELAVQYADVLTSTR